jgi:hypothetical protein
LPSTCLLIGRKLRPQVKHGLQQGTSQILRVKSSDGNAKWHDSKDSKTHKRRGCYIKK